jgi:hypothetical protein
MAPNTPTGEPIEVIAGDSWRWRVYDLSDYPNSEGWTLKYEVVGQDKVSITATFQTSGDDENHWLVEVATSATKQMRAGTYKLIGRVEGSGDYAGREETVHYSTLEILQDPRLAKAGDYQTHDERTLDVIEAAIEGRLTKDMESYSIAGRSISKIPIRELLQMRGMYRAMVNQGKTGRIGRPVEVHFGAA